MRHTISCGQGGIVAAAVLLLASIGPAVAGPDVEEHAVEATEKAEEPSMIEQTGARVVKGKVLPVDFDIRTLSTGLTVSLVEFDSPGLVAYFTAMRVGSRDEVEPGHSGFAHLFEHMMFRGTKEMPGNVYDNKVQALGADSSAWTWTDQTVYFFIAPTSSLSEV
ncbi:MAG: insulinase family protein, partial [Deltaproteobacteria bacterium]|nr:insulinase family protein [Deltaproteobacteria bacterium]